MQCDVDHFAHKVYIRDGEETPPTMLERTYKPHYDYQNFSYPGGNIQNGKKWSQPKEMVT